MNKISDMIESYILQRLAAQENGQVELRRGDIADAISCAPSQISYVLSTRFTQEKGFIVESRRGLGGFIRIAQHYTSAPAGTSVKSLIYDELLSSIEEDIDLDTAQTMLHYLHNNNMISTRELAILLQGASMIFTSETYPQADKMRWLKIMLLTLDKFDE